MKNTQKLQKRITELQKMNKMQLIALHKRLYRCGTPNLSDKISIINDILEAENLI